MAESYLHPELQNLAKDLPEEELSEIAKVCLEDFKADKESAQEWRKMHAQWLKLYFQKDTPINPPWEGSSDESMPLLAEACNQFHARSFPAMFPSRNIIRAIPVGKSDQHSKQRAERIGIHMSWQLMVKNRTYKRDKDRLLLSLPLHGSCFTKTWYNPIRKHNVVENIRAIDLVVPYGTGPRNLEDIDRKSQVIWMSLPRAKHLVKQDYFVIEPLPYEQDEKNDQDRAHDDVMGFQETPYQDKRDAMLIEQHRLLDLDDDGLDEPYVVTLDIASEKVLRIAIRYDTDEAGNPTDDKQPVEYYTHWAYLENPDGFYGLGFGLLIGRLNTAVNKLTRQTIDAGTLANIGNQSGFIDKRLSIKKGEVEMQLGKFISTESSMEDISKGIYQFKFPGPGATLPNFIELLMGRSDRLAMVTEALTGQTEKVMQPTTILALIEQGLQPFNAVQERVLGAWEDELGKLYRLNRKYMDPEEYFSVLDITGELQNADVARKDYEEDFQVKPIADPKMTTERQKLARAEAEYQFAASNPLIVNSPVHYYNVSRRYLEAIGSETIEEILPKPEQALPRVDDPYQENAGLLAELPQMPPVFPDQPHEQHLKAHQEVLDNRDVLMRLGDAGLAELQKHMQAHERMMYGLTIGSGSGGSQFGGVAPDAGNGMVPGAASGAVQPGGGMADGVLGQGESTPGAIPGV